MKIVFLLSCILVACVYVYAEQRNFPALEPKYVLQFIFTKNAKEVEGMSNNAQLLVCIEKLKEYLGWNPLYSAKFGPRTLYRNAAMAGFLLTRRILGKEELRERVKTSNDMENTFISELHLKYGENIENLQRMDDVDLINLFADKVGPSAHHPGLKARISQKAFDYFSDVGRKALFREVNNLQIPDVREKNSIYDVQAYEFHMAMMRVPNAKVEVFNWGLRWTVSDLTVVVQARLKVKAGLGIIKIPILNGGKVRAAAVGLGLVLDIGLGDSGHGTATLNVRECNTVGNIGLEFDNNIIQAVNLVISGLFSKYIRGLICGIGKVQIDHIANRYMEMMPTYAYYLGYAFDFGFMDSPTFQQHSFETIHKGLISFSGQDLVLNQVPATIPTENTSNKMAYIYITDYAINAFLMAIFRKGDMHYQFDKSILPEDFKASLQMISLMIPEIPNDSDPIIGLEAVSSPKIQFKDGLTFLNLETYFELQSSKDGVEKHAVTFILNINATVHVDWTKSQVYWEISELKATTELYKNSIPNSGAFLQKLLYPVIMAMKPMLNMIGDKGMDLPGSDNFEFHNSDIRVDARYPGLMIVETDISVDL